MVPVALGPRGPRMRPIGPPASSTARIKWGARRLQTLNEDSMNKKHVLFALLTVSLLLPPAAHADEPVEAEQGVRYETLSPGSGTAAENGMTATIHLAMWLADCGEKGEKLIDSREEGRTLSFTIGSGGIGAGLDIGVNGMQVGERRRVYVPARLNPRKPSGALPGNADLIFEVELMALR